MKKKLCIISVISDIYTDQRVLRSASALQELNYHCIIIGRKTKKTFAFSHSLPFELHHIFPLFYKGIGMYVFFNLFLFFKIFFLILKHRTHQIILWSNDLDTLLPNYMLSKLFRLNIIYDSHEIFTEVPELQNRKFKKRIWELLEKSIVPKLPFAITVNESISQWYQKKYNITFHVLRNVSQIPNITQIKSKEELHLPKNKKIIILQGTGINIHRGAEELVQSMQYLTDDYLLLIIGSGDVIHTLKNLSQQLSLQHKIIFKDRMPAVELYHYTANADLGISIDKPNNLNYLYSLPNKIFSYIHAHIPILSSRLPEIEKIITTYNIGTFIENHNPAHIAEKIQHALSTNEYELWKQNTYKASEQLNWDKEKEILKNTIQQHFYH